MSRWTINVLGGVTVTAPDGQTIAVSSKKALAALAYVVCSSTRRVPRTRLQSLLWSKGTEKNGRDSLKSGLSKLRTHVFSAYGSKALADEDIDTVELTEEVGPSDLDLLRAAVHSGSEEHLRAALNMPDVTFLGALKIRGEPEFDEWRRMESLTVERLYKSAAHALVELLTVRGEWSEIEAIATRVLAVDELDEKAHRILMQSFAARGQMQEAFRQFQQCADLLANRLDAEPGEETLQLNAQIRMGEFEIPELSGEPELAPGPATFAPPVTTPSKPELPTLCVLPANSQVADDAELERLLAEELTNALSRFHWFAVVATIELDAFEQTITTAAQAHEQLGVTYLARIRARSAAGMKVLYFELVDATSNVTVWGERITPAPEELPFSESAIAKAACRIDVALRAREVNRAHRFNPEALNAYECTLLALSNMNNMTQANYETSERLFARAAELRPDLSSTFSFWSLWKMFCIGQSWLPDVAEGVRLADQLAREAVRRNPSDGLGLAMQGHFEAFWRKHISEALALFDSSLRANPYSSFAWMLSAACHAYADQADEALRRLDYCDELGAVEPNFQFMYCSARCIAFNFAGDFEQAAAWGKKTVAWAPEFTNGLKQLLVALGHLDDANEANRHLGTLMALEPQFSAADFVDQYPFVTERQRRIFLDGLIAAGVGR